jgi:hypothetical protein
MTYPLDDETQPSGDIADAGKEQEGPEFTEDDKPGVKDFLKGANEARKTLKELKDA